jgi:hypothetical protein
MREGAGVERIDFPFILIFKSINSPEQLMNKGNAYSFDVYKVFLVCNARKNYRFGTDISRAYRGNV